MNNREVKTERDIMWLIDLIVYVSLSIMIIYLSIERQLTVSSYFMVIAMVFTINLLNGLASIRKDVLYQIKYQYVFRILLLVIIHVSIFIAAFNNSNNYLPMIVLLSGLIYDIKLTEDLSDTYNGTVYSLYEFKYSNLVRMIDISYYILIAYISTAILTFLY